MRRLAVLLLVPALAGCPALDVIEGKPSPYKEHVERVALVVAEAPAEVEPVVDAALEPIIEPPPPPACVPVFRIIACDEDGREIIL